MLLPTYHHALYHLSYPSLILPDLLLPSFVSRSAAAAELQNLSLCPTRPDLILYACPSASLHQHGTSLPPLLHEMFEAFWSADAPSWSMLATESPCKRRGELGAVLVYALACPEQGRAGPSDWTTTFGDRADASLR